MDTRFSSAIHVLVLISEADNPMTSEKIAGSVGTNASYVRKITTLLKRKGIITSRQGVSGFSIEIKPEELSLLQIYQAIYESEQVHVFDIHQNANDRCIVGKLIQPELEERFRSIEKEAEEELKKQTLADVIKSLREKQFGGR